MITEPSQRRNRLSEAVAGMRQWMVERLAAPAPPVPLERPNLAQLARAEAELPACVAACPVARKYLDLLGSLDWEHFPERDRHRPWPGATPAPRAPFVAAYLVKLDQDKRYMSDLRSYLVDHPALVWVLGFPLVASAAQPWGFDVKASVPSRKQLGRVLRKLDNAALQFLLGGIVNALKEELPPGVNFGDAISVDTKHIIAWVRENNPKDYVHDRYDKDEATQRRPGLPAGLQAQAQPGGGRGQRRGERRRTADAGQQSRAGQDGRGGRVLLGLRLRRGDDQGRGVGRVRLGRADPALRQGRCDLLPSINEAGRGALGTASALRRAGYGL